MIDCGQAIHVRSYDQAAVLMLSTDTGGKQKGEYQVRCPARTDQLPQVFNYIQLGPHAIRRKSFLASQYRRTRHNLKNLSIFESSTLDLLVPSLPFSVSRRSLSVKLATILRTLPGKRIPGVPHPIRLRPVEKLGRNSRAPLPNDPSPPREWTWYEWLSLLQVDDNPFNVAVSPVGVVFGDNALHPD